jgi:hypothetical protein
VEAAGAERRRARRHRDAAVGPATWRVAPGFAAGKLRPVIVCADSHPMHGPAVRP